MSPRNTHIRRSRPTVERLESRDVPSLVPVGPEFRVDTLTTGYARFPAIAMDASGDTVVVWEAGSYSAPNGVFARRYDASGAAVGGEFQVNTTTTGARVQPRVAMDSDGDFVVSWTNQLFAGGFYFTDVYAQRFSASGVPQGSEFLVNSFTPGQQYLGAVAMDTAGEFVIVWHGNGPFGTDGFGYNVYAKRYTSAGIAIGSEFRVNTSSTDATATPRVGMDAVGNFVIAWNGQGASNGIEIFAKRFDSSGNSLGDEILVNTYTTNEQSAPALASSENGDFIVAWDSGGFAPPFQDGSASGVFGQRFDASGLAIDAEFQVNTFTTGNQSAPAIALGAAGAFVVTWISGDFNGGSGQDGSRLGIYAQCFDSLGMRSGAEIRVNSFTSGNQLNPVIAMDEAGDVLIVWTSYEGPDGSGKGVYAQRYINTPPVSVASVQIGNGSQQRSQVRNVTVAFNASVSFASSVDTAFTLFRAGGGAVSFNATASIISGVTVVALNNFTGLETEFGSLRDGRYTLTALASQISANGQQMASNFVFGDAQGLFRYYGDMNGDRRVDISDFGFFSLAYLQAPNYNAALDFNADGRIDIADFGQFSVRFFTTLP